MSDFFERQERAKRQSRVLFFLTALIVLSVILSIEMIFAYLFYSFEAGGWSWNHLTLWMTEGFGTPIAFFLLLLMFFGAVLKGGWLRRGLSLEIQRQLGAVEVLYDSEDPSLRPLIHIVEEMSIASGVPLPRLFLWKGEEQINAFVAGTTPETTTLTVTEGALARLKRNELQGVIAHEFSHLMHSDSLINTRLFAIVSGLVGISYFGYLLLRAATVGARRGSKDTRGAAAPLGFFALIFITTGSIGTLFANILKAAVSRQREHLADASAVQFTRDREGLLGAFYKIAEKKPQIKFSGDPVRSDVSYMCIAPTFSSLFGNLFATHPPIEKRIELLGGVLIPSDDPPRKGKPARAAEKQSGGTGALSPPGVSSLVDPIAAIGTLSAASLQAASELLDATGPLTREALHAVDKVSGLLLAQALLQDRNGEAERILRVRDVALHREATELLPEVERLGQEGRLPLLDLMAPAVHRLDDGRAKKLLGLLEELALADGEITPFELALLTLLHRKVLPEERKGKKERRATVLCRKEEFNSLFSLMSCEEGKWVAPPEATMVKLEKLLRFRPERRETLPPLDALIDSLLSLGELPEKERKKVLLAAAWTALADRKVSEEERQTIRALGIALGLPVPLLFS